MVDSLTTGLRSWGIVYLRWAGQAAPSSFDTIHVPEKPMDLHPQHFNMELENGGQEVQEITEHDRGFLVILSTPPNQPHGTLKEPKFARILSYLVVHPT